MLLGFQKGYPEFACAASGIIPIKQHLLRDVKTLPSVTVHSGRTTCIFAISASFRCAQMKTGPAAAIPSGHAARGRP